jgi:hypothetical protein
MKTTRTAPRRKGPPAPRIKPGRIEDPAHLAAVRALPCLACEIGGTTQTTQTEAHHIRDGQGMGQKAGDHEAIPLCAHCHRTGWNAFHAGPGMFQWLYGTERDLLARTLERLSP